MMQLFSTDLDGTLLGNREATNRFNSAWSALPDSTRPVLVYNSGRLVDDMLNLINTGVLIAPDYLIGGVGTQIYDVQTQRYISEYYTYLAEGWDRDRVNSIAAEAPGITVQPEEFQHAFKSSWFLNNATAAQLDDIKRQLAEGGCPVSVIYSIQRDLDILPSRACKGQALAWLCRRLEIPLDRVVVAGDTGNDASMFQLPGVHAIAVDNAHPELFQATLEVPFYTSRQVIADGVLDGLTHFGVINHPPAAADATIPPNEMQPEFRLLFSGTKFGSLSAKEKNLINTAYEHALIALRKNITPLGFSACSLEDNPVTGTDANYRSVWARDGSITIINTLDLNDPDIVAAQRATLETLLSAISPAGQIPANVRIDDRKPDYGGVGNICSIDSGLWLIIACYNYYARSGDIELLRTHADHLQRAMQWLSAHDSNNDGLLEIPEAGDWTDLFGRSYNVLYDEVLWYRAHVCYGRILEFLGDHEHAADYLRWSQHIRSRILDAFWPSTQPQAIVPSVSQGGTVPPIPTNPAIIPHNRFADRQFSLGDTHYLLAEITPFAFNWRCDVFGNILAYLMHLLDIDRARTAFRYMWGVGANQPWPVANLYPVVQSGDPDWRSYYTVNLLNLPHHYHNGGIWPFIGGMWVRFIHRLGFHEIACRELIQLAKLNQLGRDREWEFNEWAHGVTGRPMGKAYQAWSAASFIKACHELETTPATQHD